MHWFSQSIAAIASFGVYACVWAQCGLLSDPNNPACTHGTGPVAITAPQVPAAPSNVQTVPTLGHLACAAYEQRINRCLVVTPNSQAHADAYRAGIETAMAGRRVMLNGVYMAGQMSVLTAPVPLSLPSSPSTPLPGAASMLIDPLATQGTHK